jgi:hypothetical protein
MDATFAAVEKIIKHTNYNKKQAKKKLKEFNDDPDQVIKDYYGIKPKTYEIKSINQEIYRQLRQKLDITEYRNNNPINIEDIRQRFNEEDAKKEEES